MSNTELDPWDAIKRVRKIIDEELLILKEILMDIQNFYYPEAKIKLEKLIKSYEDVLFK